MKKNVKRWLALVLAVALIASSGLYSSNSWLKANEDETTGVVSTDSAVVDTRTNEDETAVETENPTQGEVSQTQQVIINTSDTEQTEGTETVTESTVEDTEKPEQTNQASGYALRNDSDKESRKGGGPGNNNGGGNNNNNGNNNNGGNNNNSGNNNGSSGQGSMTMTISPTIQNAQVAYIYFNDASGAANNPLTPVTGTSQISNFATSQKAGYIIFFAKPNDGYLLTELYSNGNKDQYPLNGSDFGNIVNYPGLASAVSRAKSEGYIACLGYSRPKGNKNSFTASIEVYGVKPTISVKASCNKTKDVVPNDALTFEVTITPQTVVNGKTLTVEDVRVTSLTINGQTYEIHDLHRNSDGTYTGTVNYTATMEDCSKGEIELNVTASVDYRYSLYLSDTSGSTGAAETTATTSNSATTKCTIASKQGYGYLYEYRNDENITEYPGAVLDTPEGGSDLYVGQNITVAEPRSNVKDDKNGGIWVFDGWYLNTSKVTTTTVKQEKNYMTFVGYWTFIKVTVEGYEGTYDGAEHTIEDPVISGGDIKDWTIKYSTDQNTWTEEKPSYKNVGTNMVYVQLTHKTYGTLTTSAEVKINKRPLTITTGSDEKVYDGTALTKADVEIDGAVEGEITKAEATGTQMDVGSSENGYTLTWAASASESNYAITENLGTLTVTKATAAMTVAGYEDTYDGKSHTIGEPQITGDVTGTEWTYTYSTASENGPWGATKPEYKDAGTYTIYVKATNKNYNDITAYAQVVIHKVQLEVTTGTATKMYDGTPLTNSDITVANAVGSEVSGHTTGSQTRVGSSYNTYVLDWTEGVNKNNYETTVIEHLGTLTVTKNTGKASLTVDGYNGVYDGNTHSVSGETVTGDVKDTKWTYTYSETGKEGSWSATKPTYKDAGTYTVYVKASADNYEDLVIPAKVEIAKATISVTTASAEKVYDGKELTNKDITVTGVVKNEVTFTVTGTQTDVGSSKNTYKAEWTSKDAQKNYNTIEEHLGTLTVTKATANVSVDSYTGIYDAESHTVSGEKATAGSDWTYQYRKNENDAWSNTKPEFTNAGTYTVYVKATNKNYNDAYTSGTVTIQKRPWSITTASDEKVYDGTPLTNSTVTVEGILNDDVTVTANGSQTNVGESQNTYSTPTWREGANSANYAQPKVTLGTLKVTKNPSTGVSFTVDGYNEMYDGQAHTVSNATVTGAVEGTVWTYQYRLNETDTWQDTAPTFTNVSTTTVYVKASNANYADVFASAEVKITKAPITVTTGSASRPYDGKALTSDVIDITGNLVAGEVTSKVTTGSQTAVGSSKNTYTLTWITDTAKDNYKITEDLGTLTVTQNTTDAKLSVDGYTGIYDAKEHSLTKVEVTGAADGTEWTYQYRIGTDGAWSDTLPKFKDAGTYTVYVKASAANYGDLEASESVLITKAPLTIKTESATKVYDGTALTDDGITVTGIVDGEITAWETTGSQTVVGSSNNTYKLTWKDNVNKDNYDVQEDIGTLTVTAAEITVPDPENPTEYRFTFNTPSDKVYNGDEQKWTPEITDVKTGKTLKKDVDYTVAYDTADFTNVGNAIGVTIVGIGNYAGTVKLSYRITPIEIELTAASAEKVYDEKALTAKSYSITKGAFVKDEGLASVTVEGSQLYVGTSDNTITGHTLKANTLAQNYTITYVKGTLKVTDGTSETPVDPDKVVVKTHGDEAVVYELGQKITFVIQVTNIYDTVKNITITEQDGVTITGDAYFENVAPGAKVVTTAEYVVTEEDILNGTVYTNTVQASFSDGKTFENTDEVTIDEPESRLKVIKTTTSTPENGVTYALGETITYQIVVKNVGNITIRDITAEDELTGDTWTIDVLAPGKTSEPYEVTYVVTENDILNGKVLNVATASGTSDNKENPDPEVEPGEKEDPVDVQRPSLAVIKTAGEGEYKLGETVSYTIRVVNNGNVTIMNIMVTDELTGDSWTIDELEPKAAQEFTAKYTITEEDIRNGSVHNIATAEGTDPEGKPVEGDGEETITPEPMKPDFTLKKTLVNPKDVYAIGETMTYTIQVTNTGNVTLNTLEVTDLMQNAAGQARFTETGNHKVQDNKVIIDALAPEESVVLTCEYTVVREDAGASISNAVVASAEETPEQPKRDETDEKPVDRLYTLVIHYVDEDGNALANDYRGSFEVGEAFFVESPEIEGYTANYRSIRSGVNGMPKRDLEFSVVYQADAEETPVTPAPEAPTPEGTTPTPPATINTPEDTLVEAPTTPQDAVVEEDDNGDYQLIPIEDDETPLANMDLDDHACCILHFLIMLAALIVVLVYTNKMKKCQEHIFELREELETERKRRETSNKENAE